jgi:photosystem II stability/assembly factor-like uncharacterized protein
MSKKIIFFSLLSSLLFFGVGCVSFSGSGLSSGADGGIFKSTDKGDNWTQKVAVSTASTDKQTIGGVNVVSIVQDPQDSNAIYIGTANSGLFYSYDGGDSWQRPAQLSSGRVASVAVHPKDKCIVYATSTNRLLKSEDCSRTWSVVYLDARLDRQTTTVVVDFFNPNIVWVATDAGDVLKSIDNGRSWSNSETFKSAILKMAIVSSDSRRIYVATKTHGVWRTDNGGDDWIDLSSKYDTFSGALEFFDLVVGKSDPAVVIMANRYGLLRSRDFGDSWEGVDLLTPPRSTLIYSVAIDPKDVNAIYYGTAITFYQSPNGGVNWIPKKLPTTRTATVLQVDNVNSSVLYMGVTKIK